MTVSKSIGVLGYNLLGIAFALAGGVGTFCFISLEYKETITQEGFSNREGRLIVVYVLLFLLTIIVCGMNSIRMGRLPARMGRFGFTEGVAAYLALTILVAAIIMTSVNPNLGMAVLLALIGWICTVLVLWLGAP